MAVSYFIRYVGTTADAEAYFDHYRHKHSEFIKKYPRIRGCKLHHPIEWNDPAPVTKDQVLLLAELIFDSAEDLDFALASEARQNSRKDFNNFPVLENSDIRHLATRTEVLF